MAETICAMIVEGKSIRTICGTDGMPSRPTVFRWIAAHEEFRNQYARACEGRALAMAEEILEIADDGRNDASKDEDGHETVNHDVIARSRLRVDTRKWLMARMNPRVYGDKITQEHTGANGGPIETRDMSDIEIARRMAYFLTKASRGDAA